MSEMTPADIATELAATIRELGEARVGACLARANAWRSTAHYAVTERREECRFQTAQLDAEVLRLEAEVDALRVEWESAKVNH